MSFAAPKAKLCAFCGESLDNGQRVVVGQIRADWMLHVTGWHMGSDSSVEAPSCYDQDEELADKVIAPDVILAVTLAAIGKIRKRGAGRVVQAKMLMTSDVSTLGNRTRRRNAAKRKQRNRAAKRR